MFFKPDIGHHRCHHGAALKQPRIVPRPRDDGQQLIAVHQPPVFVSHDDAVGITIEREAEIGPLFNHRPAHSLWGRRSPLQIYIITVRLHPQGHHFGTQLVENGRCNPIGGAVGTIDDDLHTVQPEPPGEATLDVFNIAAHRVIQPGRAAEVRGRGKLPLEPRCHARLDAAFDVIGKLETVGAEKFDPVILKRIMGGRYHDPQIRPQ